MTKPMKRATILFSAVPVCGLGVIIGDLLYYDDEFIGEEVRKMIPIHITLQITSLIVVLMIL